MISLSFVGTSHGNGYCASIVGLPKGFVVDVDQVNKQLQDRKSGYGRSNRQLLCDNVVFDNQVDGKVTVNGKLQFFVANAKHQPRPNVTALRSGHTDVVGKVRYPFLTVRQVAEISSARNSVCYVVLGAICQQILSQRGVTTYSYVKQIGNVKCNAKFVLGKTDKQRHFATLHCASKLATQKMQRQIDQARADGNSLGGVVCVGASGVPMGVGNVLPYEKRLDAQISSVLVGIPSVKGVTFGLGTKYLASNGAQCADKLRLDGDQIVYDTNNCGGIVGGVSNGKDILCNLVVKPVPTVKGVDTIDDVTHQSVPAHYERADTCVVPNVGVIAQGLLAWTLLNQLDEQQSVTFGKFNLQDYADCYVVTEENVASLYNIFGNNVYVLPQGEDAKTMQNVSKLCSWFLSKNLCSNDLVVAVGGGSVGDTVGFACSIFKRGVQLLHVPTTLIAQIDSSVGGKTAVNLDGVKNAVGTFYQAKTLVDVNFLSTLPKQQLQSGKGELLKYRMLCPEIDKVSNQLPLAIRQCVYFKQFVCNLDMRDNGARHQLNFGHTVGHAMELSLGISHGEAVANGIYYETKLGHLLGLVDEQYLNKWQTQCKQFDVYPLTKDILQGVIFDKKNDGKGVCFALPPHFCSVTLPLQQVEQLLLND